MVVPAHAIDRMVLTSLNVQGNHETDLFFVRVTNRRWPGILLSEHVIDRFFIGEEDIAVEAFLTRG